MVPEYRIKVTIYDENTGAEVWGVNEPVLSQDEDTVTAAYRALKGFHVQKERFEETHYPVESTETV